MEMFKRIRLAFKDDEILSDAQKSEGLGRCWVLLKPQEFGTVSDVISYLLDFFQLRKSCPHGLILSISGFVLPPFESSCILKDNEIIRVSKKKADTLCIEGDRAADEVGKVKNQQKNLVDNGVLLLEFDKQKPGFQVEDPEDDSDEVDEESDPSISRRGSKTRKRKAHDKLLLPKKKKLCSEAIGSAAESGLPGNGAPTGNMVHSSSEKMDNSENEDNAGNNDEHANADDKDHTNAPHMKRNSNVEDNAKETPDTNPTPTKKGPSRSARRKYAKRRWLREMAKIKQNITSESDGLRNWKEDQAKRNWARTCNDLDKNVQNDGPKGLLHWKPSSQNDQFNKGKKRGWNKEKPSVHPGNADEGEHRPSVENLQPTVKGSGLELAIPEQDDVDEQTAPINSAVDEHQNNHAPEKLHETSDEENEVVPVMIRPGHIRFEPSGKGAEEATGEDHVSLETYQWNGITSKKKGQKWGKEDRSFTHRNLNEGNSDVPRSKKEKPSEGLDFDKLPLHSMPEEGEVIAFRELELSSYMTPEISSYRVGKVLSFNAESKDVVLQPVPGYPFVEKKTADDENLQPDDSLDKHDGPLEVDYSTLLDVRLVTGISEPQSKGLTKLINGSACSENASSSHTLEVISGAEESDHGKGTQLAETGTSIWEQLSEAVTAKKEQLSQNQWSKTPVNKKENLAADKGGNRSWSFKALRGSGLGPTMAILRSNNF